MRDDRFDTQFRHTRSGVTTEQTLASLRSQLAGFHTEAFDARDVVFEADKPPMHGDLVMVGQSKNDLCAEYSLKSSGLNAGPGSEDATRDWSELARAIAKFRGGAKPLVAIARDGMIVRVLKDRDDDPTDFSQQLGFLEAAASGSQGQQLVSARFDVRKMAVTAMMCYGDPEEIAAMDAWKAAVGMSLSMRSDSWYSAGFLRMVCTNGMMAVERAVRRWVRTLAPQAARRLSLEAPAAVMGVARRKVEALRSTPASLGELFKAHRLVPTDGEFAREFELPVIAAAYKRHVTAESLDQMPDKWLDSASSGVPAYKLFNYLTATASHDDTVDDLQRGQLNTMAASMFFKGPALANLAPDPFAGGFLC
jgi:hypothetical protein